MSETTWIFTTQDREVVDAVLYAMRVGCFFPLPVPPPGASLDEWRQWGAMKNLHNKVAKLPARVQERP